MKLIALGANLEHPIHGAPLNSLTVAIQEIEKCGLTITHQSSWYKTAPVPISDQPWFVNAVIAVKSDLGAEELLKKLHAIEEIFGRVRDVKWEARVLDLDLLCHDDLISENRDQTAGHVIPHPHIQERTFVLAPIEEILPAWRHPVTRLTAGEMLEKLGANQAFEIVSNA